MSIMDKQHFDQLVKGVREMKRHMAGKSVRGSRTKSVDEPDVRAIRRAADISQSQFAKLIGVNLRTLQNWEQRRTRPTGPARALLKIVASNPKSALEALHA
jgi:putative transcriptional regulator